MRSKVGESWGGGGGQNGKAPRAGTQTRDAQIATTAPICLHLVILRPPILFFAPIFYLLW